MKRLIAEVLGHAAFRDDPLVLVDVGASGGIPVEWRALAPFAIGVGFDPDARETQALAGEHRRFRRWTFVPAIVVAEPERTRANLYLTQSPFCSSTLPPVASLDEWTFSEHFRVERQTDLPALTLAEALRAAGLGRIDWLKCDTQGTDLRIFTSLPDEIRRGVQVVEFEPGLIDAYEGEDSAVDLLRIMHAGTHWLAKLEVNRTPRGGITQVRRVLGNVGASLYRDFGPGAPAWINASYLRDFRRAAPESLRAVLVGALLALLHGHPAVALAIAEEGAGKFPDPLLDRVAHVARRQMWRAVWLRPRHWKSALKRWWLAREKGP